MSTDRQDPYVAYLTGQYNAYRLLLTSPRMNRPQRELIEGLARLIKDRLEDAGVKFDAAQEAA